MSEKTKSGERRIRVWARMPQNRLEQGVFWRRFLGDLTGEFKGFKAATLVIPAKPKAKRK